MHDCLNCLGADINSNPIAYAAQSFAVGGAMFVSGVGIFSGAWTRGEAGDGVWVCVGWIGGFAGIGLICLGILSLT